MVGMAKRAAARKLRSAPAGMKKRASARSRVSQKPLKKPAAAAKKARALVKRPSFSRPGKKPSAQNKRRPAFSQAGKHNRAPARRRPVFPPRKSPHPRHSRAVAQKHHWASMPNPRIFEETFTLPEPPPYPKAGPERRFPSMPFSIARREPAKQIEKPGQPLSSGKAYAERPQPTPLNQPLPAKAVSERAQPGSLQKSWLAAPRAARPRYEKTAPPPFSAAQHIRKKKRTPRAIVSVIGAAVLTAAVALLLIFALRFGFFFAAAISFAMFVGFSIAIFAVLDAAG
jgi:hypothetical protein